MTNDSRHAVVVHYTSLSSTKTTQNVVDFELMMKGRKYVACLR